MTPWGKPHDGFRWLRTTLLLLSLAALVLSFLSWRAATAAKSAADDAATAVHQLAVSRERAECVTLLTGPFFAHVSRALVELDAAGGLTDATAASLADDAETLGRLNEACAAP